jgi:hypothetical protein
MACDTAGRQPDRVSSTAARRDPQAIRDGPSDRDAFGVID